MSKKCKKLVFMSLFAIISLIAITSTAALGVVLHRVRLFDSQNNSNVLSCLSSRQKTKPDTARLHPEKKPSTHIVEDGEDIVSIAIRFGVSPNLLFNANGLKPTDVLKPGQVIIIPQQSNVAAVRRNTTSNVVTAVTNIAAKVKDMRFGGDGTQIVILFSEMPKVEDVLRYVTISPKVDEITVDVETEKLYWRKEVRHWVYLKSANFKYRTPYTVTVKKDIPFPDGRKLEREFVRTLQRADISPSVSLADSGRYLPPIGSRTIAVKSANVSKLACSVRYVLPENIVQLLAREECQYKKSHPYWCAEVEADSEATTEISTAPTCWKVDVPNKLNEWIKHPISLQYENGVVSNGVYLLSVRNGDKEESDDNSPEYRLVCMTDLGLSVRRDETCLRVWVTSLTTGRPVPGVEAKLYASNKVPLANAKTGADGDVTLAGWDTRYEPFALVVAREDKTDFAFMALRNSMKIDEPLPSGNRPKYTAADECRAFIWTDRGIYRHGEKIMVHALLRNGEGNAPKSFPVKLRFEDPNEREVLVASVVSDEYGAIKQDTFHAPDNLPSGRWKIKAFTPGKKGALLGERTVKIEEFVPPQVRVSIRNLPDAGASVTSITYKVAAEHLFGGAAKQLSAESLVSFTDASFTPEGWKGFRFGDSGRGLKPNYTKLPQIFTDDNGEAKFTIDMKEEWGLPKAAVMVIVQGSVFETGGRPSVTRESRVVHTYPYYLGSDIPRYIKQKPGNAKFKIAQVKPNGQAHKTARKLKAELWKIEQVYNLVRNNNGSHSWDSERVRKRIDIAETVEIGENGEGTVELPVSGSGDYEFTIKDEELNLSHTASFWISSGGDDEVRANLKNPTAVAIAPDKEMYHEGERPRLTVKTPFRGMAWLAVMREKTLYTRIFEITNLTSVVELDPLDGAWAPDVDAAISVVQSVEAGKNHLAARAHGIATLRIRTRDSELPVEVEASVKCADNGGSEVEVALNSRGEAAIGERAVVTVVDEGINILTNERVPDPIGFFSIEHGGWHPLYDLYNRLFPVYDSKLKNTGAKTGGDDMAGLMNRVSPVPTRRFKPLSLWRFDIPLTNGAGRTKFTLPEFVGEVRITAFAYSKRGAGCGAIHRKVSPKLVMQPDAPRFAAPGDKFGLTLSLFNRSGKDAEVEYEVTSKGAVKLVEGATGRTALKDGASRILNFLAEANSEIGQGVISYRATGCGETHTGVIELPVRPAVAWEETADVAVLRPGEQLSSTNVSGTHAMPELTRRTFALNASPIAELISAFDYLAEYPHGCLEQTTSRMFPLIYGGGFLNRLSSEKSSKASELNDIVDVGIARVVSMLRQNDFTMWPDVSYPPWDREVSLYAAHFLVEAESAGFKVNKTASEHVKELLKKWAFAPDTNISVYACHTLALAGRPEKDRMFSFYDVRDRLSLISRARLARAFARIGEPKRARELVSDAALQPSSVKEAAFALMTLLELDSNDRRLAELVLHLQRHRDRQRFHWGTTGDNAHALMALGAYYRATGIGEGKPSILIDKGRTDPAERLDVGKTLRIEGGGIITLKNDGDGNAYVSMKTVSLPSADAVKDGHNLIDISRRFVTSEGFDVDLANLTRGELLIGEITLSADRDANFTDLVIQDLFPACFEPDRKEVADAYARQHSDGDTKWVLRSDVRDDRVIVFSKPMTIKKDATGKSQAKFFYAVRVITPGEFVLPGVRVEAMYAPEIKAQTAPMRISVAQSP